MKKIFFFALAGLIFSCATLHGQTYSALYTPLSFHFNNQNFSYSDEKSKLDVQEDGTAKLNIHFKMTDPKTAATNYVILEGGGQGTVKGDLITLEGTAMLNTFERGRQDDAMSATLTMQGRFSEEGNQYILKGTFNLVQNGDYIRGTFSGKGGRHVKLQIERGSCTVKHTGSGSVIEGKNDENLEIGSEVRTGENTRVNLVFPDGSIFRMKSNTILMVKNERVDLTVGEASFQLQKQGNNWQVITPSSVFGVLGTTFIVTVDKDKNTFINLLKGKVWAKDNKGKKVTLLPNQGLKVDVNDGIGEVKTIDPAEVEKKFNSSDNSTLAESGWFSMETLLKYWMWLAGGLAVLILIVVVLILVSGKKKQPKQKALVNEVAQTVIKEVPVQNTPAVEQKEKRQNFCTTCGSKLTPNAKFCHKCGKSLI